MSAVVEAGRSGGNETKALDDTRDAKRVDVHAMAIGTCGCDSSYEADGALAEKSCVHLMNAAIAPMAALLCLLTACTPRERPVVHMTKSASCSCCQGWADYLIANGFKVEVTVSDDIALVKEQHGIPPRQASCHTAVVDGYVIEGHVPAEDIRRLLAERPPIRGLVLPGKPVGAPGLEGTTEQSFEVLALDAAGATTVFAVHQPAFAPLWRASPPARP